MPGRRALGDARAETLKWAKVISEGKITVE